MTSEGALFRISASADAEDLANVSGTPSCVAAVLIFELNMRSSRTARIMTQP